LADDWLPFIGPSSPRSPRWNRIEWRKRKLAADIQEATEQIEEWRRKQEEAKRKKAADEERKLTEERKRKREEEQEEENKHKRGRAGNEKAREYQGDDEDVDPWLALLQD
jgi:hypothetical protein